MMHDYEPREQQIHRYQDAVEESEGVQVNPYPWLEATVGGVDVAIRHDTDTGDSGRGVPVCLDLLAPRGNWVVNVDEKNAL